MYRKVDRWALVRELLASRDPAAAFAGGYLPIGTRVRVRPPLPEGHRWGTWKGKATMLDHGTAIKDRHGFHSKPTIRLPREGWIVLRDQAPNPEHASEVKAALRRCKIFGKVENL